MVAVTTRRGLTTQPGPDAPLSSAIAAPFVVFRPFGPSQIARAQPGVIVSSTYTGTTAVGGPFGRGPRLAGGTSDGIEHVLSQEVDRTRYALAVQFRVENNGVTQTVATIHAGTTTGLQIRINTSSQLELLSEGAALLGTSTFAGYIAGTTHTVVVVNDGTLTAYSGGAPRLTVSGGHTLAATTTSVVFGRRQQAGEKFAGTILEAALWTEKVPNVQQALAISRDYFGTMFAPRQVLVPAAGAGASLDLVQTAAIALSGSASVSGNVQIGTQLNLSQTGAVALSGSVAVSGDIQSLTAALDLTQTAAVALSGSAAVSGDVQIGTSFNLAQSAAVAMTGAASVSGNIQIGTSFDLAQSGAVGLSASIGVTGDLQISSEPVVVPPQTGGGGFAWGATRKPSRYERLSKPTREQIAERVRKQREALGILPKPVQKRIEAAVKKEARRAEPSLAPLAPLAAEVAQDTGVSLQAVVDAIQAAYDYQTGLVAARIQADAARQAEERKAQEEAARVESETARAQWQQRLKVLIAADEELLKQDEQARLEAISAIRKTQQALLALFK